MSGLVLDAGALIAFDRNDRRVVGVLARALERGLPVRVPVGAVAQAWRDGRTQARLARLLGSDKVEVVPLDDTSARAAGQLCGVRGTSDVVDASVVMLGRKHGAVVLSSDPLDLRRIDPGVTVERV